jgi:hypothetical protein
LSCASALEERQVLESTSKGSGLSERWSRIGLVVGVAGGLASPFLYVLMFGVPVLGRFEVPLDGGMPALWLGMLLCPVVATIALALSYWGFRRREGRAAFISMGVSVVALIVSSAVVLATVMTA